MDQKTQIQLKIDYYYKIRKSVEEIVHEKSKELSRYEKSYSDEFKNAKYKVISKPYFFKHLSLSDIILIGDFHAQAQSARTFYRVVRQMNPRKLILFLECICSKDQPILESFLSHNISEKEFLKQLKWSEEWKFPFEHIKPLLRWAQKNCIAVYGINKSGKRISLKERDRHAAQTIVSTLKTIDKKDKMTALVQIGDFHLAQAHLPSEIKKKQKNIKLSVVYQSPEEVYFTLYKSKKGKISDFVMLSKNKLAIMSVSPWIKWQDYLFYLETQSNTKGDLSEPLDFTDYVAHGVQFITALIKVHVSTDELAVYSSVDLVSIKNKIKNLDSSLKKFILEKVKNNESFYVPEIKLAILSKKTSNHVAKVAAEYILHQMNIYKLSTRDPVKDFLSLIWKEALVYFLCKLSNPKRKSNTLFDVRNYLKNQQFEDHGKMALKLALRQKLTEMQYLSSKSIDKSSEKLSDGVTSKDYLVASGLLGGILGEKIYSAYSSKLIKFPEGLNFIFRNVSSQQFRAFYYNNIDIIESWPSHVKSKYEQF
jgi:hypothetical protein